MNKKQKVYVEENKLDSEAVEAYLSLGNDNLEDFNESYQGKYGSDEDFVQELVESCGDIPKDLPAYIHIDWESTARDIMMDYSEDNGHYFRNL